MIYLVLFIYLTCLVLVYDVCGKRQYRQVHYVSVLLLMIAVSGLRYRLGTDTIAYMKDYPLYPTLFSLKAGDFSDVRYQPLWVILNSMCRTLSNDFALVQLVMSAIHIGIWGYALRRLFPSLLFTSLYFYYLYDFTMFNMEVMREGLALSFFILGIMAFNRGRVGGYVLCGAVATLFHVFALPVFVLFALYYYAFSKHRSVGLWLSAGLLALSVVNKNFVMEFIISRIGGGNPADGELIRASIFYANDESYAISHASIKGMLLAYVKPLFFMSLIYSKRIREQFTRRVHLEWRVFETTLWISVLVLICNYSMPIVSRIYNYFHFFTTIAMSLFCVSVCSRFVVGQKRFVYVALVMMFSLYPLRHYATPAPFEVPGERWYSCYYPYSSVFDRTLDKRREHIFNYKGDY